MTTAPPPPSSGWTPGAVPPSQHAAPVTRIPQALPQGKPRGKVRERVKSITLVVLSVLLVLASGGHHAGEDSVFSAPMQTYSGFGALAMTGASVMLMWRARWPVPISLGLILLTALIPTSPLPVLIALPAAAAATLGYRRWGLILGTCAATAVSFAWDVVARTSFLAVFIDSPGPGTPERLSLFWVVPVLAVIVVVPFAATGITHRFRSERDAAQLETAAAERSIVALHREVELEQHRRALARELHDTLAANLSTLSLHASALEMTVGAEDDRANAAARTVRESAQHSLDDLRNVVRELRNPQLPTYQGTGFPELPQLIDRAVHEGTDVRTQLFITDPASCDPDTAHAVYRIVQEALSNVRRHSPRAALYLDLRGGPGVGVTIRATNWLPRPGEAPTSIGGGHGLTGMAERVELLGGVFQAGPTAEGAFGIAAWLPWLPTPSRGVRG